MCAEILRCKLDVSIYLRRFLLNVRIFVVLSRYKPRFLLKVSIIVRMILRFGSNTKGCRQIRVLIEKLRVRSRCNGCFCVNIRVSAEM